MGGPCYFTQRFSSVLVTVLNQCVKYFDINYLYTSASCADMAHLVKQESILAIVAKQQWVGPVISLIGFQVSW